MDLGKPAKIASSQKFQTRSKTHWLTSCGGFPAAPVLTDVGLKFSTSSASSLLHRGFPCVSYCSRELPAALYAACFDCAIRAMNADPIANPIELAPLQGLTLLARNIEHTTSKNHSKISHRCPCSCDDSHVDCISRKIRSTDGI